MKRGYIRVDKPGPSPDEQRRALAAAGITDFTDEGPVYIDGMAGKKRRVKTDSEHLPGRKRAINSLRAGDVLVVANAARLGTTREDILRALAAIGAKGASVLDASEEQEFACSADLGDAIAFADLAYQKLMLERSRHARANRKRFPSKSGPKSKLIAAETEMLRQMWHNPAVRADAVEAAAGVRRPTLYRLFGPRGTPIFGSEAAQQELEKNRTRKRRR